MHSYESGLQRLEGTSFESNDLKEVSRDLAMRAQHAETQTVHTSEDPTWRKARLDIGNHLGGNYYLTVDQVKFSSSDLELIEAKHSQQGLPSMNDIKDALVKLILYTNLEFMWFKHKRYKVKPNLLLTSSQDLSQENLTKRHQTILDKLINEEAKRIDFAVELVRIF